MALPYLLYTHGMAMERVPLGRGAAHRILPSPHDTSSKERADNRVRAVREQFESGALRVSQIRSGV
jgi:hypothetical protein